MGDSVSVQSVEAVEQFRRNLLVFVSKAKPLINDTFDEVSRKRDWLRSDRQLHWENELRRRKKVLQEAQEAYFSAKLSTLREARTAEQLAMRRAKEDVEFAENKLRLIRRWMLEFEHSIWPMLKQLEQLRSAVSEDLPNGARLLGELVAALDKYRDAARGPISGAQTVEIPKEQTES